MGDSGSPFIPPPPRRSYCGVPVPLAQQRRSELASRINELELRVLELEVENERLKRGLR